MERFPVLMHTALDATDCRRLSEFYRVFLGLSYRPGDEMPETGEDAADWLVLVDAAGQRVLAFNRVASLERPTWPTDAVPKQMHQDFRASDLVELKRQCRRAQELGAVVIYDRSDDEQEPLFVLADPAGHPFCLLVSAG